PPATATFRRSLAALENYTNVLLILAEGRNIEVAQAEVQALAGNVGAVLELSGVGGASAALNTLTSAFKPLLDIAAKHANAQELARVVKEVSPDAVKVVRELRNAAPEFFNTLTETSQARLDTEPLEDPGVLAAEEKVRAAKARVDGGKGDVAAA